MKMKKEFVAWGISDFDNGIRRVAARKGKHVFDVKELADFGLFKSHLEDISVFSKEDLNDFISLGKKSTNAVRKVIENTDDLSFFKQYSEQDIKMYLPVSIGDYTDFYSSEQHAYNVGVMFRDPENALLPNWKHLPVGYHGRSGSIFVSGTDFHRPCGQINASDQTLPVYSPTKRLDFELEMACIIGNATKPGYPVNVNEAEDYVFGFTLFNDWSARDIQRWEYVPLGPFLAKNFFSSMSAWVVPIETLNDFKVKADQQNPEVLAYLNQKDRVNYDIVLEVYLQTSGSKNEILISRSNFKYMYWTIAQQIAHHTVNGCNLRVGDVMASGTISGKTPESYGSMLELSWGGKNPLDLGNGVVRSFVEDGDTIIFRGYSENDGAKVDFGEVKNTVLPAILA
jgi:fumarylacetoacetase